MTELAPGIHSLGHGKGGHVHAFLIDDGGELTLVDTLFAVSLRRMAALDAQIVASATATRSRRTRPTASMGSPQRWRPPQPEPRAYSRRPGSNGPSSGAARPSSTSGASRAAVAGASVTPSMPCPVAR